MKALSLLLSLLIATTALGQKPLDRGIHKRKTGGVSILWGKNKQPAHVASHTMVTALPPLAPAHMVLPRTTTLMESPVVISTELPVPRRERRTHHSLRPLNRKGLPVLALPRGEKRMLHRPFSRMDSPNDGEATYDWASVAGFAAGLLALLLMDSSTFLTMILWLVGLGLSVYGVFRTKNGNLRGRKLARIGVALFGITPLVILVGVAIGLIGVF